jgi:adenylate kinase
VVFLGPPGAGKGTQAVAVAQRVGVPHLATGDMLRDELERNTSRGQQASAIVAAGDLVSDELVNAMVAERLAQKDCATGWVLDGFPRTVAQARALDQMLGEARQGPIVIHMLVEYSRLIERLTGRRTCPQCGRIYNVFLHPPEREGFCDQDGTALVQRPDDQEDVIRERLAAYEALTRPLVDFYRDRTSFFELDANSDRAIVSDALFRILERTGCVGAR